MISTANATFDRIIDMEDELRGAKASLYFAATLDDKDAMKRAIRRAEGKLFAAIDALNLEEMVAYGEYRKMIDAARAADTGE